jgi:hypothetical protein
MLGLGYGDVGEIKQFRKCITHKNLMLMGAVGMYFDDLKIEQV